MRIFQNLTIIACLSIGVGTTYAQDNIFQAVGGLISTVNDIFNGSSTTSVNTSNRVNMPNQANGSVEYSETQEQNLTRAIKPLPDKEAVKNMTEAYPVIVKVLSIVACSTNENLDKDRKRIMRYATTDSYQYGMRFPMDLQNHRSGCVVVERIDGYRKIANNAFAFNALYVSPQSGESQSMSYKMIKEPSGDWLFRF